MILKKLHLTEDEMDDIRVELELDDKTVQCKILTIFETEGQDYIALLPLDENGEEPDEGEVYIYRYFEDEEGNPSLENIEDEDEAEMIEDIFEQWLDDQEFEEM